MSKQYTQDEMVTRIWDREEIQEVMARRAYYAANEERRREITELWVRSAENIKTASYGKNWGYYVGLDNIISYYVVKHDEEMYANLKKYSEADPSIEYCKENLGYGCMSIMPINTPLIQIAENGLTAQGLWYCIGQFTMGSPDGTTEGKWQCQRVAADFVKEDGQWRIWHLVEEVDIVNGAGECYEDQPVIPTEENDPLNGARAEFGAPMIPMLTHDGTFNWLDNYPPMPQPYYAYETEMSYGPGGHPKIKKERENIR